MGGFRTRCYCFYRLHIRKRVHVSDARTLSGATKPPYQVHVAPTPCGIIKPHCGRFYIPRKARAFHAQSELCAWRPWLANSIRTRVAEGGLPLTAARSAGRRTLVRGGVIVCNRWFRYRYVIGRINNTLLSHFTAPDQTPFRWEVFAQGATVFTDYTLGSGCT